MNIPTKMNAIVQDELGEWEKPWEVATQRSNCATTIGFPFCTGRQLSPFMRESASSARFGTI